MRKNTNIKYTGNSTNSLKTSSPPVSDVEVGDFPNIRRRVYISVGKSTKLKRGHCMRAKKHNSQGRKVRLKTEV